MIDRSTISEPQPSEQQGPNHQAISSRARIRLVLIAGALSAVATSILLFFWEMPTQATATAPPSNAEPWFITANGRIINGEPFISQSACETARHNYISKASQQYQKQLNNMSEHLHELGNHLNIGLLLEYMKTIEPGLSSQRAQLDAEYGVTLSAYCAPQRF